MTQKELITLIAGLDGYGLVITDFELLEETIKNNVIL